MEYKIGDIVQLKSGGPGMTVDDGKIGANVQCVWFRLDGSLCRETLSLDAVQLYDVSNSRPL